jgi:single-strand DNA-binding protein
MSQGLDRISIIGWLGRDPEPNDAGTATRLSVGVTERWRDAEGTEKEHTEWFRVVCFNGIAAACVQYLSCGRQIYVDGRLRTRRYTSRDGEDKAITELLAQNVIFLDGPRGDDDRQGQRPKPDCPRDAEKGNSRKCRVAETNKPLSFDGLGIQNEDVPF